MVPAARRAHLKNVVTLCLALFGLATLGGCPIFWGHDRDRDGRDGHWDEHRGGDHDHDHR
jgi:hypothetical protein